MDLDENISIWIWMRTPLPGFESEHCCLDLDEDISILDLDQDISIWIWMRTFLFRIFIRTFLFGFGSLEIPLILKRSEQSPPISCPSMIHKAKEDPNPAKNQESGPCTHLLMPLSGPRVGDPNFPPELPKIPVCKGSHPWGRAKTRAWNFPLDP